MESPVCPKCSKEMVLRETTKFARKPNEKRKFWGCRNYPYCFITVGAHADGTPVGIPAPDKETSQARIEAHEVFDKIWRTGILPRKKAYRKVAEIMGIPEDECHVGMFGVEQCKKFIKASKLLISIIESEEKARIRRKEQTEIQRSRRFGFKPRRRRT